MRRAARITGMLYILQALFAPFRLIYIQNSFIVTGDGQATMANIAARDGIFRLGILTDVVAGVLTLFVVLSFFRLFRDEDRDLASLLVILGGFMVTPIYFFNLVNDAAALVLASAPKYLNGFNEAQRAGLVALFARLHGYGVLFNEMFWGLWLLPLAALTLKTRLVPRFLAIWLFINGAAYMLLSAVGTLSPRLEARISGLIFPALLAEVVLMFWLAFGRLGQPLEANQPGVTA